ncbi:hypothetical protein EI94DRAFT_266606 [Lactarius quietus]|nr:hypothetical protein EI94DRAFT_266606 [Lactarius quietus]
MMQHPWLIIPFLIFSPRHTTAFTWNFTSVPVQCQNLSVAVNGTGQPPYSLLLVPIGNSPLPNDIEVRTVQNIPFPGNSTSLSFNLNYPANSLFVTPYRLPNHPQVSDNSGIGAGVVNPLATVLPSSDSSCYNPTQTVHTPWEFSVDARFGVTQCDLVRLWWKPGAVNGTVKIYCVIPGGNLFAIPEGSLATHNTTGIGFDWTVDLAGGTSIALVAGDDSGIGSGGSVEYMVAYSSNISCLSSIPSTASSSAGGSSSNTGAIAGGVAGGLALIVAFASIAFFYARRLGYAAISKERPVNVLYDDEDGDGSYQDLPDHYVVEPYLVSDPNIGGPSVDASTSDRLLSITPADSSHPQGITAPVTTMRKNALPAPLRPTNIIQHDDAGPRESPASVGEPEMIELPPAYTNIRSVQSPDVAPTSTTASSPVPSETTTP